VCRALCISFNRPQSEPHGANAGVHNSTEEQA
jgi:hypothetical protein